MSGASASKYDLGALRAREFPWAARGENIYLNNASTGPLPERTVQALAAFTRKRAEPFRITLDDQFGVLETSREMCARLVGARPHEIAMMVNTTYGLNLAARALPLRAGDVVVTSDREFPANIYPWMALGASGVRLDLVPCVNDLPDEEGLLAALDRPGVRVLTISWVQFSTGYKVDLARLGRACRERGIYFVVDAIQGVGAASIDVRACNVDILSCGAQKWLLSPWGAAFTYVRQELVAELVPNAVGWMASKGSDDFSRLVDYDLTWRDDARRFEVVTLPYQEFAALNASLSLFEELGLDAVQAHIARAAQRIVDWCADRDDVRLVTPSDPERRAGIVAIAPRDPAEASERLTKAGVTHSLREGAIRLSPHFYTTDDEIDRALQSV